MAQLICFYLLGNVKSRKEKEIHLKSNHMTLAKIRKIIASDIIYI